MDVGGTADVILVNHENTAALYAFELLPQNDISGCWNNLCNKFNEFRTQYNFVIFATFDVGTSQILLSVGFLFPERNLTKLYDDPIFVVYQKFFMQTHVYKWSKI